MLLKNKVKTEKIKAFSWDLFPGVEFDLAYQGRKQTTDNLRSGYITVVEGTEVRQEFSADKFSQSFVAQTVKGWRGLKLKHVQEWMLVDETQDLEEEVEYCQENALFLYENWKPFEDWVAQVVHSVEQFREKPLGDVAGTTKEVSNLEG